MKLFRRRWPSVDPLVRDWWPVVVVLVLDQLTQGLASEPALTPLVATVFALGHSVPLRWRRTHPVPVAAAVVIAALAQVFWTGPTVAFGAFTAALIAAFSLGCWAPRGHSLVGIGGLVVGLAAVGFLSNPAAAPIEVVFPVVYGGGSWGLGRLMRSRRLTAERMHQLITELADERDERLRLALQAARTGISREIHDIVSHSLGVIVVQAEAAGSLLDHDPAAARRPIEVIQHTSREALEELRRTLTLLREDEVVPPQPGFAELPELIAQFQRAGITVTLEVEVEGDDDELPADLALTVYRLIQEALTNVLKHAGGAPADVRVSFRPNLVEVDVADRGPGCTRAGTSDSRGHGPARHARTGRALRR